MWLNFLIVFATYLILFAPNALMLFGLGFDAIWSMALSPLVSISFYAIVGQLLALVGIASSAPLLMVASLLLAAILTLLFRHRGKLVSTPEIGRNTSLLYIGVAVVASLYVFLRNLPSPDALFQAYDAPQHLNVIQAFADSGLFSSIGVSAYLAPIDQAICPAHSSGFYPSAWHTLCAMAVQITNCKVTVAINASELTMTTLAHPLSWAAFLTLVFEGDVRKIKLGSIACVAFTMFPWEMMVFGPIYPNFVGFCVLPAAMSLFILTFSGKGLRTSLTSILTLLPCMVGLALLHPNTIFTAIVLLSFWCAKRIHDAVSDALSERTVAVRRVASWAGWLFFLLFVLGFWIFCFKLPALQEIVTHRWKTYATGPEMLYNLLALTYTRGFWHEVAPQYLLGAIVVFGAIRAAMTGKSRWITLAYLTTSFMLFWVATYTGLPGRSRFFLGGFWYTDPVRLASMFVMASIPCAVLGLDAIGDAIGHLAHELPQSSKTQLIGRHLPAAALATFVLINYFPGVYRTPEIDPVTQAEIGASLHTPFGDISNHIHEIYDLASPLSLEESEFLTEVSSIVGDDLVINDPLDGSLFAYGVYGIRTYYRTLTATGAPNETPESKIIRTNLYQIDWNPEVLEALRAVDAKYILLMDDCDVLRSFINLRGDADGPLKDLHGVGIDKQGSEHAELVRSNGKLRLYRIVY